MAYTGEQGIQPGLAPKAQAVAAEAGRGAAGIPVAAAKGAFTVGKGAGYDVPKLLIDKATGGVIFNKEAREAKVNEAKGTPLGFLVDPAIAFGGMFGGGLGQMYDATIASGKGIKKGARGISSAWFHFKFSGLSDCPDNQLFQDQEYSFAPTFYGTTAEVERRKRLDPRGITLNLPFSEWERSAESQPRKEVDIIWETLNSKPEADSFTAIRDYIYRWLDGKFKDVGLKFNPKDDSFSRLVLRGVMDRAFRAFKLLSPEGDGMMLYIPVSGKSYVGVINQIKDTINEDYVGGVKAADLDEVKISADKMTRLKTKVPLRAKSLTLNLSSLRNQLGNLRQRVGLSADATLFNYDSDPNNQMKAVFIEWLRDTVWAQNPELVDAIGEYPQGSFFPRNIYGSHKFVWGHAVMQFLYWDVFLPIMDEHGLMREKVAQRISTGQAGFGQYAEDQLPKEKPAGLASDVLRALPADLQKKYQKMMEQISKQPWSKKDRAFDSEKPPKSDEQILVGKDGLGLDVFNSQLLETVKTLLGFYDVIPSMGETQQAAAREKYAELTNLIKGKMKIVLARRWGGEGNKISFVTGTEMRLPIEVPNVPPLSPENDSFKINNWADLANLWMYLLPEIFPDNRDKYEWAVPEEAADNNPDAMEKFKEIILNLASGYRSNIPDIFSKFPGIKELKVQMKNELEQDIQNLNILDQIEQDVVNFEANASAMAQNDRTQRATDLLGQLSDADRRIKELSAKSDRISGRSQYRRADQDPELLLSEQMANRLTQLDEQQKNLRQRVQSAGRMRQERNQVGQPGQQVDRVGDLRQLIPQLTQDLGNPNMQLALRDELWLGVRDLYELLRELNIQDIEQEVVELYMLLYPQQNPQALEPNQLRDYVLLRLLEKLTEEAFLYGGIRDEELTRMRQELDRLNAELPNAAPIQPLQPPQPDQQEDDGGDDDDDDPPLEPQDPQDPPGDGGDGGGNPPQPQAPANPQGGQGAVGPDDQGAEVQNAVEIQNVVDPEPEQQAEERNGSELLLNAAEIPSTEENQGGITEIKELLSLLPEAYVSELARLSSSLDESIDNVARAIGAYYEELPQKVKGLVGESIERVNRIEAHKWGSKTDSIFQLFGFLTIFRSLRDKIVEGEAIFGTKFPLAYEFVDPYTGNVWGNQQSQRDFEDFKIQEDKFTRVKQTSIRDGLYIDVRKVLGNDNSEGDFKRTGTLGTIAFNNVKKFLMESYPSIYKQITDYNAPSGEFAKLLGLSLTQRRGASESPSESIHLGSERLESKSPQVCKEEVLRMAKTNTAALRNPAVGSEAWWALAGMMQDFKNINDDEIMNSLTETVILSGIWGTAEFTPSSAIFSRLVKESLFNNIFNAVIANGDTQTYDQEVEAIRDRYRRFNQKLAEEIALDEEVTEWLESEIHRFYSATTGRDPSSMNTREESVGAPSQDETKQQAKEEQPSQEGSDARMARYYQRLGISPSAAKEQVKAAFRAQARTYHPDLNSAPDAEEKFKEIGEAYEQIKKAQGWN